MESGQPPAAPSSKLPQRDTFIHSSTRHVQHVAATVGNVERAFEGDARAWLSIFNVIILSTTNNSDKSAPNLLSKPG